MLTAELKEKKQRFLKQVQDEFDRTSKEYVEQFPMQKDFVDYVAQALLLLQEGEYEKAFWPLLSAYNRLVPDFYALSLIDLGLFAFRLEPSFLYLHDVAPLLWESRKDFQPHLSGALRAAYYFLCLTESGRETEEAFSIALDARNELYETFGDTLRYQSKQYHIIGNLLSPKAVAKLKQILLDTLKDRQGHAR